MPKNSKGPVLIISSEPDPHADEVQKHLTNAGVPFVRFNSNEISEESNIRYEMPPHEYLITHEGKEYKLSDFRSIWYRKPHFWWADHDKFTGNQGIILTYKHAEKMALIENLMDEAEHLNMRIISPLSKIHNSHNKLMQLRIADEIGMQFPHTYVGSSLNEIEKFMAKYPHSITKTLGTGNVEYGKYQMFFTTEKFNFDYIKQNGVDLDYPIFLQEEIKKKAELRITIVGKKIFACLIDSQARKESSVDWRNLHPDKLKHEIYELPSDIKTKCFTICERLGLSFAAIDMAISPKNKYIFFEINANGQYLWVEKATKMPISQEIASFIAK